MSRNRVKITKMNLTSLMDVFTILVFFLLVNSGSVEVVEAPKDVTLPESVVESKPRETVVISISAEEVLVQGKLVAFVDDILSDKESATDPINARLAELKESVIGINTKTVAGSQEVTILADRSVPFTVIKTIMSTCTAEGYENVSLAVIQKATQVASAS
jgi:biopolymer transport protein ExbD